MLEQVRARWREVAAPPSAQLLSLMRRLGNAHEAVGDLATAAERREADLKTTLKRAGVDLFGISTEEDLVAAIVRMAGLCKRRRR